MECSPSGSLVHGILFETPWTVVCQAPLSMEFSRQEYWSGLPFPFPGDLPNPGIKPTSHISYIGRHVFFCFFFLPLAPPGKPPMNYNHLLLFVSMLHLCQICPLQDGCYGSLMLSYKTWLYLFLAVLGLCYSVGTFSSCGKQGLLSSCGARASRCWAGALNRTGFGSWVAAARGLSSCATQA